MLVCPLDVSPFHPSQFTYVPIYPPLANSTKDIVTGQKTSSSFFYCNPCSESTILYKWLVVGILTLKSNSPFVVFVSYFLTPLLVIHWTFLFPGLGGSALHPEIFTLCTIFGRMPGIEPELLQPQPGVLPMSYTHLFQFFSVFFCRKFRLFLILMAGQLQADVSPGDPVHQPGGGLHHTRHQPDRGQQ